MGQPLNEPYLSNFEILSPPYSYSQDEGLERLVNLHALSEQEDKGFRAHLVQRVARVCCKQDKISKRHTCVDQEWLQTPRNFGDRSKYYQAFVEEVFVRFYPPSSEAPEEMIHVTCTGYNSPSAAQKIVLQRGWEQNTQVTHAYHMGCMAAFPAIRMGLGYASSGKKTVDIIHTELCSLHLNPALHTDDQLVAQSLFADGLIKYSLTSSIPKKPALRVLTVYEELIPETDELMKWECAEWGLKMTLRKEIPVWISRAIVAFMGRLEQKSGLPLSKAYYAVHPGGPKIIDLIGKKLELSEEQLATSAKILYNHGNMSSATLPHIWEDMVNDPNIPNGSYIVGLAFGPGICMSGAVLQKVSEA